jgi:uncharacterized membrane protein
VTDRQFDRPTGITVAVILIMFTSSLGLLARIVTLETSIVNFTWVLVHIAALVVAYGMWRLQPWGYWSAVLFTCAGLVLALGRLTVLATPYPRGYQVIRLIILGAWLAYFLSASVRESFAVGRSSHARAND